MTRQCNSTKQTFYHVLWPHICQPGINFSDFLSLKFCMYIIAMSFICELRHDVSLQLGADCLFPWMTADNTVTTSRLDSRGDQTNLGRSDNLHKSKTVPRQVIRSGRSNTDVRILA